MNKSIENLLDKSLLKKNTKLEVAKLKYELAGKVEVQDIEDHADVLKAIEHYGNEEFRKELKLVHHKYFGDPVQNLDKPKRNLIWIGLITLILMSLAIYTTKIFKPAKSPEQLFVEYYTPFSYANGKRNVEQQSMFELGALYQRKEYKSFIEQYELFYKQEEKLTSDLILAIGISYLETAQPYKAIYQFDKIIDKEDFNFSDNAFWYKALALLKANEFNSCKDLLSQLSKDDDSDFREQASSLLNELKKSYK